TPPSRPPRWRIRSPRSAGSCPRRNTSKDPADRQPYPSAGRASSRRPEAGAPPLRERAIAHAPLGPPGIERLIGLEVLVAVQRRPLVRLNQRGVHVERRLRRRMLRLNRL